MILYLDTSSLVKLYVEESGTLEAERLVEASSLVCTSVVTYAEARSALARLRRESKLSEEGHERAKANLEEDWARYLAIEVTREVWHAAGDLAEKHALRGFDSIHLASFLHLANTELGEPAQLFSFDDRLNGAEYAETEQMERAARRLPGLTP